MTWDVLVGVLKDVLRQFLSALAAELIERLLPKDGPVPPVRSPRELRRLIAQTMAAASDRFPHPDGVRGVAAGLSGRLNRVLMDRLWERLYDRRLVTQPAWKTPAADDDLPDSLDDLMRAGLALTAVRVTGAEVRREDDTQEIVLPKND